MEFWHCWERFDWRRGKQKPARTPAFVWTKEVFRTWTFFVKETQINAHWAGRDSSKLELPPLFGPRCSEDRSKLLTWVELYRRNLAWSLRFSKKVCNVYINDNDSQLQVFLKNFPYFLMSLFEDFWERKTKCEKFGKIRVLLIFLAGKAMSESRIITIWFWFRSPSRSHCSIPFWKIVLLAVFLHVMPDRFGRLAFQGHR